MKHADLQHGGFNTFQFKLGDNQHYFKVCVYVDAQNQTQKSNMSWYEPFWMFLALETLLLSKSWKGDDPATIQTIQGLQNSSNSTVHEPCFDKDD